MGYSPVATADTLWFLTGGKKHEVAEGNPDEQIEFIQEIMKGRYHSDVLYEMDEDEFDLLHRRAGRVKYCGKVWRWRLGATGVPAPITYACGVWRVCPLCQQARIDKWKGRTLSAAIEKRKTTDNGALRVVHVTHDSFSAKVLKALLGRERYICFPTEEGSIIITNDDDAEINDLIDNASDILDSEFMDYDELDASNWLDFIDTPKDKRISGSLGKPEKKDDGKTSLTSYSLVVKGAPERDELVEAYAEAFEEVFNKYNPTTKGELEDTLFQLAMRWKDAILRIGKLNDKKFQVFVSETIIRADLTRIALEEPIQAKYRLEENILARWADLGELGG